MSDPDAQITKKSRSAGSSGSSGFRFPDPTPDDVAALRAARRLTTDPDELWRLLESMSGPTLEELRRRPIFRGEPFRWPGRGPGVPDET